MDNSIIRNIVDVIKTSNDKTVIYKALVKLRTDLVKDREGIVAFRECGGIPPVVRLLNRPYEKILEVATSILGNCCTDDKCCEEALQSKVIAPLLTILKSIPNPAVQCRACRLLGNLAKDNRKEVIGSQSAAISQSICLILEENQEIPTLMMAARAIKFLLIDGQFLFDFNKTDGFNILVIILRKYIKNAESESGENTEKDNTLVDKPNKPETVGRKLNQPREEYFREVARHLEGVRSDIFDREMLKAEKLKKSEFTLPTDKASLDLVGELLRCIHIASETRGYVAAMRPFVAQYLFPCMVFFTEEDNVFRSMALRTLANFATNPASAFLMSGADAVTAVCYLAMSFNLEKPLSDSERQHCLNIICLLSGDACNRAKIRRSGALQHLLERARSYSSIKEISMILFALNNFQYDHLSMDMLLRGGLVGILIKELDAFLTSEDTPRKDSREDKKGRTQKRKNIFDGSDQKKKSPKIQCDGGSGGMDSPTSNNSQYMGNCSPSSPCSSRSISPASFSSSRMFYDHDEGDEEYSPVCSDIGDSDDETAINIDENSDIMKMLVLSNKAEAKTEESDPSDNEEDDKESIKTSTTETLPSSTIDIIDNLLLRITLQIKNREDLRKPETIKTIIEAIHVFGGSNNNFSTSLGNIITESAFFVTIIKQDTIHSIYQMTRKADLKSCGENLIDSLTTVAESGYGQGELLKLLSKGDALAQKRAATAVSFVIKTPKILYQYLIDNGAIYTLLNCILNRNDEMRFEAVDGITSLATTLRIFLPTYDLTQFNHDKEFDEASDIPPCEDDDDLMKFILHRGCSKIPIKFDKKLLTQNSDVFNSMLNSDFRESKNREVHLKDYTVHGIKYFLNLMKLASENQIANIPPIYHFDSILEAYELSRMYILESLEKSLFELIVCRLSEKSVLNVFEWSLKNYNPNLSEVSINYFLSCSDISSAEKVELFRQADLSTYSKEWNQMIVDAILVRCQNVHNIGAELLLYA